ncbi:MAG TPA: hypothetical protein VKX40_12320, partial [Aequorivita sp.]|nr:hypothetical protein [Aequorivita sp.]
LSYGTLWHFFETQLKYPITSINTKNISSVQWSDYDVLILPEGNYKSVLDDDTFVIIEEWIGGGGKLIAYGNAVNVFDGKEGFDLVKNEEKEEDDKETLPEENLLPYADREMGGTKDMITGSIYKLTLDNTHPLAFGYGDTYYSLKLGSNSYSFLKDGYNVGYIKGDFQIVSGFAGEAAAAKLKNSIVFAQAKKGKGSVIYLLDDVLFRSFWQNGKLFLANAVFFVE